MNARGALARARVRFGKNATATQYRTGRCVLGVIVLGLFNEVRGEGPSWEIAFLDADVRNHDRHGPCCADGRWRTCAELAKLTAKRDDAQRAWDAKHPKGEKS